MALYDYALGPPVQLPGVAGVSRGQHDQAGDPVRAVPRGGDRPPAADRPAARPQPLSAARPTARRSFLQADRDGDPELYKLIGRTATLQALAETMIVRSSNLATNLLIDHLEVPFVTETHSPPPGLESLRCVRGVEDEAAFARGYEQPRDRRRPAGLFPPGPRGTRADVRRAARKMFDILFQQRFNGMLPAGIPDSAKARVAHKTGEISTVTHDAGMIFLPGRAPYVLVVLTEYAAAGNAAGAQQDGRRGLRRRVRIPERRRDPLRPMNQTARDLPVVDGLRLPEDLRALLRPGRTPRRPLPAVSTGCRAFFTRCGVGRRRRNSILTPHVRLSELLIVDSREAPRLLEEFPHYVPCAVSLLARVSWKTSARRSARPFSSRPTAATARPRTA